MSAERLRQAADRLDALAEAATPGRWWTEGERNDGVYAMVPGGRPNGEGIAQAAYFSRRSSPTNAAYIAAMHPDVGKAVAAWLHHAAARAESKIQHGGVDTAVWSHERDALAVANAILGGAT